MRLEKIAKSVGCTSSTVRVYLCRSEFSHISITKGFAENIRLADIERLKNLLRRKLTKKK